MDFCGGDIAPGEERRMMVEVITGLSNEPGAECEPVYGQYYLSRPANSVFREPLDFTESNPTSVEIFPPINRSPHQKYQNERERLKTFEGVWKPDYNVTKEDLARDGFIYKGPGDRTMCVYCLKSIRRWDDGDSVPGEHKRLYPNCPWVREKVGHLNIPISTTENMKRNMRVTAKGQPQYTDMTTAEARFKTFSCWKTRKGITVNDLVRAGFFYDGNSDIVTCYDCGITIPGWEKNLHEHHLKNSPACPMTQSAQQTNASMDVELSASPNHRESSVPENEDGVDMESPAVQAIVQSYGKDYSMDEIRTAVQALKLSKGSGHFTSGDILKKLDPEFDS